MNDLDELLDSLKIIVDLLYIIAEKLEQISKDDEQTNQ